MKQGILVCSGGISTTMIANKLNELAEGKIKFTAKGIMTDTSWLEYIDDYSIILISPQIQHFYDKIKEDVKDKNISIYQVLPDEFSILTINKAWDKIKNILDIT